MKLNSLAGLLTITLGAMNSVVADSNSSPQRLLGGVNPNAAAVPFERLNLNDTALLIIDLQVGLYQLARDFDHTLYYNNMIAHSALGKLFNLPTVLTTSAQQGMSLICFPTTTASPGPKRKAWLT